MRHGVLSHRCAADYRMSGAVLADTSDWLGVNAQQPGGEQRLDALSDVFDRSLPVLGSTTSTDRLELVRCQPGSVEQHATISCSVLARRASAQVHDG